MKAPNGQNIPIVVKDNNDGTYSCTYPDIKLQGAHILEPKLNGSLVKNAPFTVGAEPGEVDLDNFDIDWGELGPEGQVVVAGEKKKVTCRARVCLIFHVIDFFSHVIFFSILLIFYFRIRMVTMFVLVVLKLPVNSLEILNHLSPLSITKTDHMISLILSKKLAHIISI